MADRGSSMKAAALARHTAIRQLIAAHGAEFAALYEQARESCGLPAKVSSDELIFLRRRVAELEARDG